MHGLIAIIVWISSGAVQATEVQALIRESLKGKLGGSDILTTLSRVEIHSDSVAVESVKLQPEGTRGVALLSWIEAGKKKHRTVPFQIDPARTVWVSNRALAPGETLPTNELVQKRVGRVASGCTPIANERSIPWEVRRAIPSGRVICREDLRTEKVIERGAVVDMVLSEGVLKVRGRGRALQAGRIGETIRVENLDSKKAIYGEVSGVNEVMVGF